MECTECKFRKQLPIKRCKHFELGGDKKKKVYVATSLFETHILTAIPAVLEFQKCPEILLI